MTGKKIDMNQLRALVAEDLPIPEIAARLEVTADSVRRAAKRAGLLRPRVTHTPVRPHYDSSSIESTGGQYWHLADFARRNAIPLSRAQQLWHRYRAAANGNAMPSNGMDMVGRA